MLFQIICAQTTFLIGLTLYLKPIRYYQMVDRLVRSRGYERKIMGFSTVLFTPPVRSTVIVRPRDKDGLLGKTLSYATAQFKHSARIHFPGDQFAAADSFNR